MPLHVIEGRKRALRLLLAMTEDKAQVGKRERTELTQLKKTIQGQVEKISELELALETVKQSPIIIHGPRVVTPTRSIESLRRLGGPGSVRLRSSVRLNCCLNYSSICFHFKRYPIADAVLCTVTYFCRVSPFHPLRLAIHLP